MGKKSTIRSRAFSKRKNRGSFTNLKLARQQKVTKFCTEILDSVITSAVTWQDIRAKTKCKFSELKKLKMENGEGPSTIESLTELDKKILSLIYPSAVSQAMEVYGHADIEEPEIDIKFEELDEYDEDYNTPESLDEPFEPHIEPPIITLPIEVPIEPPPLAPIQKRLGSPTLNGTVDDNRTLKKYYYEEKLNLLREKNFIKQQKLEISRQKVKALEGIRDALQNRRK